MFENSNQTLEFRNFTNSIATRLVADIGAEKL